MTTTVVRVGLLGCGVVGGALVELLDRRREVIELRTGVRFEVGPVAVRSLDKPRPAGIGADQLTTDPHAVVTDPSVDVVIELIGGVDPARELVAEALRCGKPVVTGNKALLATAGSELYGIADANGVDLLFEAAVAGGIPFIRPLRESLAGEDIVRVLGILNGTTNYILTRMTEAGTSYADALAEAQSAGFAEADPTADVEGHDAAAKIAIVASLAHGTPVTSADVYVEGITAVSPTDITQAAKLGFVVKLLAVADAVDTPDGPGVAVRVHPTMVPEHHPMASVRESFNAVFVQGRSVGDLMFYGRGAGGGPTASAVLGDLIDAAHNLRKGTHASVSARHRARILGIDHLRSAFYLCLEVDDRPGVLATVAGVFGDHEISIRSMEQVELDGEARLVFITHDTAEAAMAAAVAELRGLDVVDRVDSVLRVLGE